MNGLKFWGNFMLLWVYAFSSIFAIKALCAQFLSYLKERTQDDSPLLMIPGPNPSVFYLFFLSVFFFFFFCFSKGKRQVVNGKDVKY